MSSFSFQQTFNRFSAIIVIVVLEINWIFHAHLLEMKAKPIKNLDQIQIRLSKHLFFRNVLNTTKESNSNCSMVLHWNQVLWRAQVQHRSYTTTRPTIFLVYDANFILFMFSNCEFCLSLLREYLRGATSLGFLVPVFKTTTSNA